MYANILHYSSQYEGLMLIFLGLLVGVISGLLGVGGGVLMTPALHLLGLPLPVAVGTTLTQMVASSFSGSLKHYFQGHVSIPLVLFFGLPTILGVLAGKEIMVAVSLSPRSMKYLPLVYGCFLLALAILMLLRHRGGSGVTGSNWPKGWGPTWVPQAGNYKIYIIPVSLFSLLVGVVSGLTGLGGGFFFMPVMLEVLGVPLKLAVGSSLGVVVLSSSMGALTYAMGGISNLSMALMIAVGSVTGSFLGAAATKYIQGQTLKTFFAVLVFIAALSIFLKFFDFPILSFYLLFTTSILMFLGSLGTAFRNYKRGK